jgi:broad specificity phosphatase PhoE
MAMRNRGLAFRSHTILVLVRHAHTAMAGRFCGLSDPPLSAKGVLQLAGLRRRLEDYPITHIFSSDLRRARQTAEAIAHHRGLRVENFGILHELAFGSWEGLDWEQVMARDPEYAQHWLDRYPSLPAPGGEYFEDFFQRVHYAMNAIATQVGSGCGVVVTHAGVIRTFLGSIAQLQGVPFEASNCVYAGCQEVWWNQGQWILPQDFGAPSAAVNAPAAWIDHRG